MKKLIFTLLLSTSSLYVEAQRAQDNDTSTQAIAPPTKESVEYKYEDYASQPQSAAEKPSNYGSLVIDWGFDFLRNNPSEMDLKFWQSRFMNICLCYNIRLGYSHFTMSPGIGLGFERYQFAAQKPLGRNAGNRTTEFQDDNRKISSSGLDARYIDFLMLEARFSNNIQDPKESFFIAIGGKLGALWKASYTIKYTEDDETKTQTTSERFNLNKMRYGFHARAGWGRFGLCYTYMFSSLFNKNQGPGKTTSKTHSLGIAIDLF